MDMILADGPMEAARISSLHAKPDGASTLPVTMLILLPVLDPMQFRC